MEYTGLPEFHLIDARRPEALSKAETIMNSECSFDMARYSFALHQRWAAVSRSGLIKVFLRPLQAATCMTHLRRRPFFVNRL